MEKMKAVEPRSQDPYFSTCFAVKFDKQIVAGFSEVTGLQVEIEVEEYREGGLNGYIHRFAGKARYPARLVLKHGFFNSREMWKWQNDIIEGNIQRKNISIVLHDAQGNKLAQWDFEKAYPVKWSGPDFRAHAAEIAMETLELVHDGFTRA